MIAVQNKQADSIARNRKIARIWCLVKDISMTEDELYLAVESVTGKHSISALKITELDLVCKTLNSQLFKQNRKKYLENSKNRKTGVAYLPTPAQQKLVADYIHKLTLKFNLNNPDRYLEAICNRTFKKEYKSLNRGQMQRLIEALKSIYQREPNVEAD